MGRPVKDGTPVRATKLRYHLIGRGPMYKIAAAADMAPSKLSAYSLGTEPIPAKHLMALSEVLEVPEDDLVGEFSYSNLEDMTPL